MKKIFFQRLVFMFIGVILFDQNVFANSGETKSLQTFQYNRRSEELMKEKEPHFLEARDLLLKALVSDPYSPELHMNLGLALEGLGQLDKAIASYKTAEKLTSRGEIKFLSIYNQAQALAKLKKVDEAIENYQKALNYSPANAQIKTNIELLMKNQKKGGGGGEGEKNKDEKNEGDDNKDQKDGQGDKEKKNEKEPKQFAENPKQNQGKSQKFNSKELSENDVRKILEDIKGQEQRIRQDYDKQGKTQESVRGKDW